MSGQQHNTTMDRLDGARIDSRSSVTRSRCFSRSVAAERILKGEDREESLDLREDESARRHRRRRRQNPSRENPERRANDVPRRGGQPVPVHLADHPDLVLPLQEPRHHRNDQPAHEPTRAPRARSLPRKCSKRSTRRYRIFTEKKPNKTATLPLLHRKGTAASGPDRSQHLLPVHRRVRNAQGGCRPRQQTAARLQHAVRQPTVAGRHDVRAARRADDRPS